MNALRMVRTQLRSRFSRFYIQHRRNCMEAVVYDGQASTLTYCTDFPCPTIKNDNEVIIKVHYAGICGTDIHIVQGEFPALKDRPFPLGHENSGEIHEVGKNSVFKVGQKVVMDPTCACLLCDFCRRGNYQYCSTAGLNNYLGIYRDGGWAQYMVLPQHQVLPLPESVTTEQGGVCEPLACVAHSLDRAAPLRVGDKILVLGAGIIGNLYVSALHHHGHRDVTVSEPNEKRLEIVKRLETGFRLVSPDTLACEENLFDVIIDSTGVGKAMEISFNYLNQGGKYLVFGCCPTVDTTTLSPFELFNKEITVIGAKINPYSFVTSIGWLKTMGDRYVNYHKLGIKTYKLSEYEQAIQDLKAGLMSKAMFKMV